MTGSAEGPPMDVAKKEGQQHQHQQVQNQNQNQQRELDCQDSVRARLLAISQVEPARETSPLEERAKAAPQPTARQDDSDEFRRRLMSISYADVALPAQ